MKCIGRLVHCLDIDIAVLASAVLYQLCVPPIKLDDVQVEAESIFEVRTVLFYCCVL